jgi:hypothetical protein
MTKEIFTFLVFFSLFSSCSKQDEEPEFKIPLERTIIDTKGFLQSKSFFSYDNQDRLTRIDSDFYNLNGEITGEKFTLYTYNNDNISIIEEYLSNDILLYRYEYKYVNDKISEEITYFKGNLDEKRDYIRNSEGVLVTRVLTYYDNDVPGNPFYTHFKYSDDSKTLTGNKENGDVFIAKYDVFKSPFSEIPSYNESVSNIISYDYYNNKGVHQPQFSYKYSNSYDEDGFLIEVLKMSGRENVRGEIISFTYNK